MKLSNPLPLTWHHKLREPFIIPTSNMIPKFDRELSILVNCNPFIHMTSHTKRNLRNTLHILHCKKLSKQIFISISTPSSTKPDTLNSCKPSIRGVWMKKLSLLGSHGSPQILIKEPFSILYLTPTFSKFLNGERLLQIKLGLELTSIERKLPSGKYLVLSHK